MGQRLALIVGNTDYHDPRFSTLSTPAEDVTSLAALLKDPAIGGFHSLEPLINQEEKVVSRSVEKFFAKKQHDDLLLFYFSGHGMLDEEGLLYFALKDTDFEVPRSSSLSAEFVREAMDRTRSERVVLILDCCHSGAFAREQKGVIGGSVGTKNAFEPKNGRGRWVLTATDATQYAWEGSKLVGATNTLSGTSVFTRCLVEGLQQGEADVDQDGLVSVRDLSNYLYAQVTKQPDVKQTPCLWSYKEQGNLFIASNPRSVLPRDLMDAIKSPFPNVRYEAVELLKGLADNSDQGVAVQAKNALTRLISDDSRRVSRAAAKAMGTTTESERFRQGRFANLAPPPQLVVSQDDPWQDRIRKTFRRSKLSTKQSFQAAHSKIQDVFDSVWDVIWQHKTLVFRIEISLLALLFAVGVWHFVPTNNTQVAGNKGPAQTPVETSKPTIESENNSALPIDEKSAVQPMAAPPVAEPPKEAATPAPLQVSELVMKNYLIEKIQPPYPLAARKAHVQGQVVLQAFIGRDGSVQSVSTINGKAALAAAATQAVQQWRYRPYPDQTNPIPVQTLITFNFSLKPPPTATTQAGKSPHTVSAYPANTVSLAATTAPTLGDNSLPGDTKIYSRRDGVSEPQKIYGPDPAYTQQASKARLEGAVVLQIVVKPDGTVGTVKVVQGLGKGLDQSAQKTISTWRFKPSLKDGKPVAVRVDVTINFFMQH